MRTLLLALACGSMLTSFALLERPAHRPAAPLPADVVAVVRDGPSIAVATTPGGAFDAERLDARVVELRAVATGAPLGVGGGPGNLTGDNGLSPDGFCCAFSSPPCPSTPGIYAAGDVVYLNSYWTELLPDPVPPSWGVSITAALKLPDGAIAEVLGPTRLNFGDLTDFAGLELQFCIGLVVTIPNGVGPAGPIEHGFSILSVQGGQPTTFVNSFSVL